MSKILDNLSLLTDDEIHSVFAANFIFEFGESTSIEINNKIGYSNNTAQFLDRLVKFNSLPTVDNVLSNVSVDINTLFLKAEKLCYSAFTLLFYWKAQCEINGLHFNDEHYNRTLYLIAYKCSRMKLNKGNNFFDEYFNELNEIIDLRISNLNNKLSISNNIKDEALIIIGTPIRIENLLIAENDIISLLSIEDAKKACEKLGQHWRLPTEKELKIILSNKDMFKGLKNSNYWSSTHIVLIENFSLISVINFQDEKNYLSDETALNNTRAVRSF